MSPGTFLPLENTPVSFIDTSVAQETEVHYLATKIRRVKGKKGFFPCGSPMRRRPLNGRMELGFCTHSLLGIGQIMNYSYTTAGRGVSPSRTNLC